MKNYIATDFFDNYLKKSIAVDQYPDFHTSSMNGMVRREGYLEQLHASKGATGVIKVITGMRRCGKTTLMEQFEDDLRSEGVDDEHIFHVNFESFEGYDMLAPDDLRRELKALPRDGTTYILLDEIYGPGRIEHR